MERFSGRTGIILHRWRNWGIDSGCVWLVGIKKNGVVITADIKAFANIPVSIILGIILGASVGYLLYLFFETAYAKKHYVRNSMKVIIVLGCSFLLIAIEGWLRK
ncbi:hypothetical protein [Blautia sp.]|uniref:hypothetical protein n=1 Tax=Blautia sp. TaxID=1955243 RepID=UPI003521A140